MKKLIALSSALALGLTVAACDGPKENAAEDAGEQAAEATNASAEAAADAGQITQAAAVGLLLTLVMLAGFLIARAVFRVKLNASQF